MDVNLVSGSSVLSQTPLFYSAKNSCHEVAAFLIDQAADPNFKDKVGQTPIFWAAVGGNGPVLSLLLGRGAKPTLRDTRLQTPLFYAVQSGVVDTCRVLIENHCCVDDVDSNGQSVFLCCWSWSSIVRGATDGAACKC